MSTESVGWFEWATGTSYDDASTAAKQGAARGLCQGFFGPALCGGAGDPVPTAAEVQAQQAAANAAAAQGAEYCDRTTIAGRAGFCEARDALRSVSDLATSPALTLAAGAVAVGVGTLALLALSNALGVTPVLQAAGRAGAAGIRGAARVVGG